MTQPTESAEIELVTSEVQNCLEKVVKELGVKDFTTDISAGTILGDNYLGIIAKVVVKGKDKNGKDTTLHFIVKSAPRQGLIRKMCPIRSAYDREVYIYSKVLPEFAKLQEERGIGDSFKSYAKYYKSTMNDMNEALIMENMREIGFKLKDRHQPLDYNHVLLVLREYGKFHAVSFAIRDQNPELFKDLSDNTQDKFFIGMIDRMTDTMQQMADAVKQQNNRALNSLDPINDAIAYARFENFQENMYSLMRKVISPESAGKYGVIIHGDCWINNMLFKYNPSKPNAPTEVCLLDWQLSCLGSPARDLSYFIFASTEKDLRDEHYDNLIKEYYDSFVIHLRKLGSDPDKLFPFEILQQHLKEFSVFGLYMSMMLLNAITSEVEEIPDFNKITEMEDVLETFKNEPKNINEYKSRLRGIVLDFVRLGYNF